MLSANSHICRGVAVALLLGVEIVAQNGERTPISVCELLNAPRQFSGRLVSIRARLVATPEWLVLVDPQNRRCGRVVYAHPKDAGLDPKPTFDLVQDPAYELFWRSIP